MRHFANRVVTPVLNMRHIVQEQAAVAESVRRRGLAVDIAQLVV